jgi:hypothetical protein
MKASVGRAVAMIAMVGVCLVPLLPTQHVHRGVVGDRHARTLIHRHLAPHTAPNGTHVDHPGVAEGEPEWLADPQGILPQTPTVTWDVTVLGWHALAPPMGPVGRVLLPSDTVQHAPPFRSPDPRGPPL